MGKVTYKNPNSIRLWCANFSKTKVFVEMVRSANLHMEQNNSELLKILKNLVAKRKSSTRIIKKNNINSLR